MQLSNQVGCRDKRGRVLKPGVSAWQRSVYHALDLRGSRDTRPDSFGQEVPGHQRYSPCLCDDRPREMIIRASARSDLWTSAPSGSLCQEGRPTRPCERPAASSSSRLFQSSRCTERSGLSAPTACMMGCSVPLPRAEIGPLLRRKHACSRPGEGSHGYRPHLRWARLFRFPHTAPSAAGCQPPRLAWGLLPAFATTWDSSRRRQPSHQASISCPLTRQCPEQVGRGLFLW